MKPADKLISIIVPVYQVEAYLPVCVKSILNQTYSNWELILVDDGSMDRGGELCDRYVAQDSRIRVIHQPNQGVSKARNAALDVARGDYLAFIDSDDLVKPDFLQILYENLVKYDADIACCCAVAQGGEIPVNDILPLVRRQRVITDPEEFYADIAANSEIYWSCIWGKLFRAGLAKQYRFRPLRYGEDQLYMVDLFSQKPKVHLDTYEGYYYVNRSTSAMGSSQGRNLRRLRDVMEMEYTRLTNLPLVKPETQRALAERCARQIHGFAYSRVILGVQERDALLKEAVTALWDKRNMLSGAMRLSIGLLRYAPWLYGLLVKVKNRNTG